MSDAILSVVAELGSRQREQAQSVARPARFRYLVTVTGNGETRLTGTRGIKFGTAMVEEPSFTFGLQACTPLPKGTLPLGSAIVLKYHQDSHGLYRGADMGFRVESFSVKPQIRFWLTFEGTALRSADGLS